MIKPKFKQAVIIGGSIAGIMAARAASDFCEQVTILDRDDLASNLTLRKGAPHIPQPHTLLEGGRRIMENFFPGLTQKLLDKGNLRINATADLKWFHHGVWKYNKPIELEFLFQSRTHLEQTMRKCLLGIDNVKIHTAKVLGLEYCQQKHAITGVITQKKVLNADLVIDASGRNSRLPQWLLENNCHRPQTTEIPINIKYQTRLFHRPKTETTPTVIYPKAPESRHSAGMFPIIDDQHGHCWLTCIMCREEEQLPADLDGFIDFTKNLDQPDLHQKVLGTTLASDDVHKFHFKSNKWHHYEKCRELPDGIFAIGDSFGHINPIYGQGMSLAAQEAEIFHKVLATAHSIKDLNKSYHKWAANTFKITWQMVLLEDWRYPKTPSRPLAAKWLQWYTGRLHELCAHDHQVTSDLYHVLHLLKPSLLLAKPSTLAKVLFSKNNTK